MDVHEKEEQRKERGGESARHRDSARLMAEQRHTARETNTERDRDIQWYTERHGEKERTR